MNGAGTEAKGRGRQRAARLLLWLLCGAVLLAAGLYAAWRLSPWPSALFYRYLMDRGGVAMDAALARHVPPGVVSKRNESYAAGDPDALLDVHYPASVEKSAVRLPAVIWIHGGGFLSGSKDQIANYARILAARGYVVASVDYTLAPSAQYPTPLRQVNAALAYLAANAERFHIDAARLVLAGDSAGAQIASQLALVVSSPAYAKSVGLAPAIDRAQLAGVILHCGLYDRRLIRAEGAFAGFLHAVGRSYFGAETLDDLPALAEFSVVDHVTADYPPAFISAGNADPLLPHSLALARALEGKGVAVDRLFFPDGYTPPLGHEYQFDLDTEAGRIALERSIAFLAARTGAESAARSSGDPYKH